MKVYQCEEIAYQNSQLNILVGPNSTGKSYDLNRLFLADTNGVLVEKDGACKIAAKITIADNGADSRFKNLIEICKKMKNILKNTLLSTAAKKLLTIIDIILTYNLNSITAFYFDEPENSLDDFNIKNVNCIIQGLLQCNKKIFMVTHSPRLLENLRPPLGSIFLKKKMFEGYLRITEKAVYKIQQQTIQHCQKYITSPPKWVSIYIEKPTKFYNLYVDIFMHSQDFYRSLFYDEITLAEGLTEKYIMHSVLQLEMANSCFIFSHGKFNMPFLINFYHAIDKKVYCIFDSDIKNNNKSGATQQINQYIEKLIPDSQKIIFEPNLESELNVNLDTVIELFGDFVVGMNDRQLKEIQHKFKPFIAVYSILANTDKMDILLQKLKNKSKNPHN